MLAGTLGILILAALVFGFVYSRPPAELSSAEPVQVGADGTVRIPLSSFQGTALRRFVADVGGSPVRFFAVPVEEGGEVAVAFDACLMCGTRGYYKDGPQITCLHCGSAIYPPSIGQPGGCNPIPLAARTEGGDLVISVVDLRAQAAIFGDPGSVAGGSAHQGH